MAFLCCNTDRKEFVFAQKPYREDIGDGKPYWEWMQLTIGVNYPKDE